ncbi:MAG: tetratricopeptide repeat protein, partial [Deltaproteobacteria bacterium]|nr:tetratricopeptide repeat protein [Deltaproteobacteria bacterium]
MKNLKKQKSKNTYIYRLSALKNSACFVLVLSSMLFSYGCNSATVSTKSEKTEATKTEVVATQDIEPVRIKKNAEINKSLEELAQYTELALANSDFSAGTLLMLADEYFDESSRLLQESYENFEYYEKLFKEGKITDPPALPLPDHAEFIEHFTSILEKYPNKRSMEMAEYALGYALYEQGRPGDAIEIFEEFLIKYRRNKHFAEVAFRLGELYFDLLLYEDALLAYSKVLQVPRSVFYSKALYKTGWTYFKLEQFNTSIDFFSGLINEIDKAKDQASTGGRSLRKESIMTIARAIAHIKTPGKTKTIMTAMKDTSYGPKVLLSLGRLYSKQTRMNDSFAAYNLFKELFPLDPTLPLVYSELAMTLDSFGKVDAARIEREALVNMFHPKTLWYDKNFSTMAKFKKAKDNKKKTDETDDTLTSEKVNELVGQALLDFALEYHEKGKKEKNNEYMKKAVKTFKRYIEYYPTSPRINEATLLLAEASFDSKNYAEASVNYAKVMLFSKSPIEAENAAFAALISIELNITGTNNYEVKDRLKTTSSIKKFYIAQNEESKRKNELLEKVADIYIILKSYEEARRTLEPLLNGPRGFIAYKKTGETYFAEKNFLEAIEAFNLSVRIKKDPEINDKLAKSHYILGGEYKERGENNVAMKHFLKTSIMAKGTKIAEDSLVMIGQIYVLTDNMSGFRSIVKQIKKTYPESNGPFKLFLESGSMMEAKFKPIKAAGLYIQAIEHAQTNEDKEKLVFKSVKLYEEAGDYKATIALLESY